jgi:hypothetical protein
MEWQKTILITTGQDTLTLIIEADDAENLSPQSTDFTLSALHLRFAAK